MLTAAVYCGAYGRRIIYCSVRAAYKVVVSNTINPRNSATTRVETRVHIDSAAGVRNAARRSVHTVRRYRVSVLADDDGPSDRDRRLRVAGQSPRDSERTDGRAHGREYEIFHYDDAATNPTVRFDATTPSKFYARVSCVFAKWTLRALTDFVQLFPVAYDRRFDRACCDDDDDDVFRARFDVPAAETFDRLSGHADRFAWTYCSTCRTRSTRRRRRQRDAVSAGPRADGLGVVHGPRAFLENLLNARRNLAPGGCCTRGCASSGAAAAAEYG